MSTLASLPLGELLERVGARTPAPGGGAVACAAGALAAALAQMVVAYSLGKKSLAEHQPALQDADRVLRRAREMFLQLADEDATAYALVNELMKLPEADPRRRAEWGPAVEASTQIPLAAIAAAADLLRLAESLAPKTNRMLHSDLAIAAVLAEAAARASVWNVRVNASSLPEGPARRAPMELAERLLAESSALRARVESACAG